MPDDAFRTGSGRLRVIGEHLPPIDHFSEYVEARGTIQRLERQHADAAAAADGAHTAFGEAVAADRADLAAAHLKGAPKSKLPAGEKVAAARAAIEEAERQRDSLEEARAIAYEQLVDLVRSRRTEWSGTLDELIEAADADRAAAFEAFLEQQHRRLALGQARAWVAAFATDDRPLGAKSPTTNDLVGEVPWRVLEPQLRQYVRLDAPAPRTLGEQVRHAGRVPADGVADPGEPRTFAGATIHVPDPEAAS